MVMSSVVVTVEVVICTGVVTDAAGAEVCAATGQYVV